MSLKTLNLYRDYEKTNKSLFLGERIGLLENIKNEHENIEYYFQLLKSLDWREDEIDITPCLSEFKELPKEISDLMIKTLSWQWEADSCAALGIVNTLLPFANNLPLISYLVEVTKNEVLHSRTYSHIVRFSFDNPTEVMKEMLELKEATNRLQKVDSVFAEAKEKALLYSLGESFKEYDLRKTIMKTLAALLALERIQFMASFAITFGLAETGYFIPIAKLVQKICNDELQVHVRTDKEILRTEFKYVNSVSAFIDAQDEIVEIIREIVDSELAWIDFLLGDKDRVDGIVVFDKKKLKNFVLYAATDVCSFLNISIDYPMVTKNPLSYMNKWVIIDSHQISPQEQDTQNYLLGGFIDDSNKYDYSRFLVFN